jgi:benzoyl-CoA reductase/2-hydroxyglutaryl-CoA dehydratase subunit BcrC/BadD/HgdB
MCEAAESEGYPVDLCSYGRTGIGDILLGEKTPSPQGVLPKPDFLMTGCQDHIMIKWFDQISRYYGVPKIVFDVMFTHDYASQDENNLAQKYVEEQLLELVAFLEDLTGRTFNWDRLEELFKITKKSHQLWQEMLGLRENIPSPFSAWDLFIDLLFPIRVFRGRPEAIEFYEVALTHYREMVNKGIGVMPNEKYRLHFNGLPPWFKLGYLAKKLASHNALLLTGVYALQNRFEDLDPSRPIESYATTVRRSYFLRGTMSKINDLVELVKKYSLDGILMGWSQTCRAFTVGLQDIMEIVEKRTGAPSALLQGDTCDARLVSDKNMNESIEAFMEVLANKSTRR